MKRRARAAAVVPALLLPLALTACGPTACEQAGGEEVVDYFMPVTTLVQVGKTWVPMTNQVPVYRCELPEGGGTDAD